jgi:hypothetical protein
MLPVHYNLFFVVWQRACGRNGLQNHNTPIEKYKSVNLGGKIAWQSNLLMASM